MCKLKDAVTEFHPYLDVRYIESISPVYDLGKRQEWIQICS